MSEARPWPRSPLPRQDWSYLLEPYGYASEQLWLALDGQAEEVLREAGVDNE